MEYKDMADAVNSLGFPVVVCGALFWLVVHLLKSHSKVLSELKDVVSANTHVLNNLLSRDDKK